MKVEVEVNELMNLVSLELGEARTNKEFEVFWNYQKLILCCPTDELLFVNTRLFIGDQSYWVNFYLQMIL